MNASVNMSLFLIYIYTHTSLESLLLTLPYLDGSGRADV